MGRISIILWLFLLPAFLGAQVQQKYSLMDCYEVALKRNISVQKANNQILSNQIDLKNAGNRMLPAVSFDMGHYLSFGKNIDPVTNVFVNQTFSGGSMGLGLDLKVFSGFNNLYSISQARYLKDASEFAKQKTEMDMLVNITVNYAKLLFNKEEVAIRRNNISRTLKELAITEEKVRLGKISKTEYYTVNARVNSERADLVIARNDSVSALQSLKQLLNIPYDDEMDIIPLDTAAMTEILLTDPSAIDLIDKAIQKHPALMEARMNQEAARISKKIARSSLFPRLSVGMNLVTNYIANETSTHTERISLQSQMKNNFGRNMYVSAAIPLFSQTNNINRIRKAEINISNAQYSISETENAITNNVMQLVNDYNAAKQKYAATASALEQNTLSYNIYEEKYKLGLISSLELITSKEILDISRSRYLQSKFEVFLRFQILELLRKAL